MTDFDSRAEFVALRTALGLDSAPLDGGGLDARSPIDDRVMARVGCASP